MKKLINCPICGQKEFENYKTCKDYTVSHEEFTIVNCKECNFKFTNPIPDLDTLADYYKSEDYISHSDTTKGLISKLYHLVRTRTLTQKVKLINSLVARGTILDYGCGTGMFLSECKKDKWKTIGIEPDNGARGLATKHQLKVFESKEELAKQPQLETFNVITLWHVLEHVVDLRSTIDFLKDSLVKNGYIIIAVPNYKSFDAEAYDKHWAAYDLPRHLYHFDKATITRLMSDRGFSLTECKPMLFDSFYVSMLSEKYKNGKSNLIGAFLRGFKSNLKAFNSKEYSSVIYIFKKQ